MRPDEPILQEITAGRLLAGEARFDEQLRVAELGGDHVWMALVQHLVVDPATFDAGGRLLDAESVVGVYLGCFRCEQVYSARLATRRCSGTV